MLDCIFGGLWPRRNLLAERKMRMQVWQCILLANTSLVLKVALTLDCSCPAFVIFYNPALQRCVVCTQDARPCALCLAAPGCVSFFFFLQFALSSMCSVSSLPANNLLVFSCFAERHFCRFCDVPLLDQVSSYWLSELQKHGFRLNKFLIFHTDSCLPPAPTP